VFCGDGAGRAGLVRARAGLANVRFLDLQPAGRSYAEAHLAKEPVLTRFLGQLQAVCAGVK